MRSEYWSACWVCQWCQKRRQASECCFSCCLACCCDQNAWAARTLSRSSWGTGSPLLCWGDILAVCTNVFHLSYISKTAKSWPISIVYITQKRNSLTKYKYALNIHFPLSWMKWLRPLEVLDCQPNSSYIKTHQVKEV